MFGGMRDNSQSSASMSIRLVGNQRLSLGVDGAIYLHEGWFSQSALPLAKAPRSIRRLRATKDGGFMALSRFTNSIHRFDAQGKRPCSTQN